MQIQRLFAIVYLLIEQKSMTAKQLAAHFEVSTRTILRDIDVLCSAGIPLYATRGKGGGIHLMDGYVLNKVLFSKDEQTNILAALEQLSATAYPQTEAVLLKLKGVFVQQNADWIEVDYSGWGASAGDKDKFTIVSAAILHRQALRFAYSSTHGETATRLVYPLKLCFKSMAWYVSAYCTLREDYRLFKLSRMNDVETTGEGFPDKEFTPPPTQYKPQSYTPVAVTLRFVPGMSHRVYDEFDRSAIEKLPDGTLLVRTTLYYDPWLINYLFSYGPALQVLEPPALRRQIAETAQKLYENHR